jgi:hypothetical protein
MVGVLWIVLLCPVLIVGSLWVVCGLLIVGWLWVDCGHHGLCCSVQFSLHLRPLGSCRQLSLAIVHTPLCMPLSFLLHMHLRLHHSTFACEC